MPAKPGFPVGRSDRSRPVHSGKGLVDAIRLADRATGASKLASDAYWSFTHPVDRLTGKGRAAHQSMEVPWVAGRPWYHGSSRVFEKYDPKRADPSSLYGPGHYITDDPAIASSYTKKGAGSTENAGVKLIGRRGGNLANRRFVREQAIRDLKRTRENLRDLWGVKPELNLARRDSDNGQTLLEFSFRHPEHGPNVTKYAFEPDDVLDIRAPLGQKEYSRLVRTLMAQPRPAHAKRGTARAEAPLNRAERALADIRQLRAQAMRNEPVAMNAAWHALVDRLGPTRANEVVREAGFDAIAYPGGAMTGGKPHNALVVLNQQRLKRGGAPNPQYAGMPRPVHRRDT